MMKKKPEKDVKKEKEKDKEKAKGDSGKEEEKKGKKEKDKKKETEAGETKKEKSVCDHRLSVTCTVDVTKASITFNSFVIVYVLKSVKLLSSDPLLSVL